MRTLNIAGSNSPGITDLKSNAFRGVGQGGKMERNGPMRSAPVPFRLVANVPYNVATGNPERRGLILQNKDPAADMFYSFGSVAALSSLFIAPRGSILLDFICPTDAVWVFAASAISGCYCEFAPIAG